MKTYDPRKPLFSIHIPKCAGTSFSRVLQTWFKGGFRAHYFDERNNKPPEKYELFSRGWLIRRPIPGMCIHGHFNHARGIGVYDYYPNADQFITILREPFELHISEYFYVQRVAQESDSKALRDGKIHPIIAKGWTLQDYLQNVRKSKILDFLPPEINRNNYREIISRNFLYVGISESLQESVNGLSRVLGFQPLAVPQLNTAPRTEPIPEGARSRFEQDNELEMEIYQFVKDELSASSSTSEVSR